MTASTWPAVIGWSARSPRIRAGNAWSNSSSSAPRRSEPDRLDADAGPTQSQRRARRPIAPDVESAVGRRKGDACGPSLADLELLDDRDISHRQDDTYWFIRQ